VERAELARLAPQLPQPRRQPPTIIAHVLLVACINRGARYVFLGCANVPDTPRPRHQTPRSRTRLRRGARCAKRSGAEPGAARCQIPLCSKVITTFPRACPSARY
jgi:hypothetical protein